MSAHCFGLSAARGIVGGCRRRVKYILTEADGSKSCSCGVHIGWLLGRVLGAAAVAQIERVP